VILKRVKLINFRNLEKIELDVSPQINIFLGRNGQGKTNLLEGLSYLALGRSHRGCRDRELIRFGKDHCHVSVGGEDGEAEPFLLEATLHRDGTKRLKVDGQPVERQAELVGHLSVVQFSPDDVELARGSPERRRRFLDYTLSVISADYFRQLLEYRRTLSQKNRLLKQRRGATTSQLDVWDEELVRTGAPLLRARAAMIETLEHFAREAYAELSGGESSLELEMRSTVLDALSSRSSELETEEIEGRFRGRLQEGRGAEVQIGHSLVGPHRDQLELLLRGRALRRYGSQGENRSASIALKLAQGEILFERTKERPLVLLDDIFSELDRTRTEALQSRLHREHQIFIATARVDHVLGMRAWEGLKIWRMENGVLEEQGAISSAVLRSPPSVSGDEAS
jgi:DNA replication and repair protein RecF